MGEALVSTNQLDFMPEQAVFPSPADWRDTFIYFLLVDRFDDNRRAQRAFDDSSPRGRDPGQGKVFQGGNLKGIQRRLNYIKGLGANAIWLSPVLKNRQESADSYHGYGIQNFLDIDPRFGTVADLRNLVRDAHARGMYVIMDIILNHTGDNWGYPGDLPYYYYNQAPGPFDFGFWRRNNAAAELAGNDAVWPVELQRPECYKRRGQIRNWSESQEAIDGDFLSLKELDIRRADVLDSLIKIYKHWIAVADLDGFRIDTVKHMESSATAIFCNAIREYCRRIGKNNFFIFGEIVAGDETLQHYLGRNSRVEGTNERFPSLDAALDFPLYFILEETIKGMIAPTELRQRYERFKTEYADHGEAGQHFVGFVDNHDQMSRPYRRFMHGNPFAEQTALAIGYLLTSPGVPCIYYGTEQGFDGGGDNDSYVRECMFGGMWGAFDSVGAHFFNSSHPIYKNIARISAIRQREPALRYGRQYFREISSNGVDFGFPIDGQCTLAYSRILDDTEIVIALNLDAAPRADYVTVDANLSAVGAKLKNLLEPRTQFAVEIAGHRSAVKVPLAPHGMAILRRA